MNHIKSFLISFLANTAAIALFAVGVPIALILFIVMAAVSGKPQPAKGDCAAIVVNLSDDIVELNETDDPITRMLNGRRGITTYRLIEKIKAAAADKQNRAIFIYGTTDMQKSVPSSAQLSEIRQTLEFYKSKGKKVVAYLENPALRDYYLASVADKIFLNPLGEIPFKGLAAEGTFFGNALKKYGVEVSVVKVGKLKSFGETFTSDKMSPDVRDNLKSVLDSIWSGVLTDVSKSRKIERGRLEDIANVSAIVQAEDAVKFKLVDKLAYQDEVVDYMREFVGKDDVTFKQISVMDYAVKTEKAKDEIAVVYLNGEIIDNAKNPYQISPDTTAYLLKDLRNDPNVSAIVLRIDSGGGSAYASEVIRREIELAAQEKPVIVSISGMAASGAYWISTAADAIVADRNSITGSIGVFSIMLSAKKLAGDFGVTFDTVKTSEMADIAAISRAPTPAEIRKIQESTDMIYERFAKLVGDSRKISKEELAKFADGRIFTGEQALKLKLCDRIGGIEAAVALAAESAAVKTYKVEEYPRIEPLKDLIGGMSAGSDQFVKSKELKAVLDAKRAAERFTTQTRVYARIPFDLKIN